ncbi:MAG: RnfABCDGE type electron transport complex subunit G [Clostridia bacterium]|nr:RnfABCDGE type electron transport complex subunit G [Clostridia bacterium]
MRNKEILVVSLKLFLITAVTSLLLAAANKITAPIIAQNAKNLEVAAKQEVLPMAADFMTSEIPKFELEDVTIDSLSVGLDKKGGNILGYVVTATSKKGYGGNIRVMVGIDKDLKVLRAKIMESSETAGLGANASKPQFIDQFIGADSKLTVVKGEAQKGEVSAITSATVTSKAVTSCVNAALDAAKAKSKSGMLEDTAKRVEEINQETDKQLLKDKEEGTK